MTRVLTVLFLIFSAAGVQAQVNGTISLGPDVILPTCSGCDTLKAVTTSPSIGTSNYIVSQITYNPFPYTPGTVIPLFTDDLWSSVISMPFDFCFFNNTYNQFIVSSNGQVSFNIAQAGGYNSWSFSGVAPLPNSTFTYAFNSIMSPYHDILPAIGGSISYDVFGTAPNRILVVSWNVNPMFACNSMLATQQIAMYEGTNVIETYIANKPLCSTWNGGQAIHGIENNGGTVAYIVPGRNLPTQWSATNDAWSFTPTGGGSGGGTAGVTIDWFDMNGAPLATNVDSLVVCPAQTTSYVAKATFALCGGYEYQYDTVTIIKQPPLVLQISNIVDVNCYAGSDGSFDLSCTGGSGNFTFTMNGSPISAGTVSGLIAGTYSIVATDAYNCTATTEVIINQPPEVQLSIIEQINVWCKYQNTGYVKLDAIGGVPPYMYQNGGGVPSAIPEFGYMYAGNYRFYVSDAHGCLDSVDTEITQPDSLLTVELEAHIATCINKMDGSVDAYASGGTPPYGYEWNSHPMQYGATATNLETGVYHVVVKDANGCVTATQVPVEQELCCRLFMPDAFTPNGDTKNDTYKMVEYGGGVIMGEFRIYNRWGQEVFSTRDISKGWDGTYKGQVQNSDTYHYVVVYQCNDKGVISQKIAKGDLILVR
ncbi:MAG: gliding motility-associated C-terminal domain-containing protein [Chitinophagaceae bacterium]|nr:gliding motility-associated C-terminal domain-containing protein [Chitinophagaceae bacterium]